MFKICDRKGFHITFDNGYTVSVQFGAGNYSDNYDCSDFSLDSGVPPSATAEVAAWDADGNFINIEDGSEIAAWTSADKALEIMNYVVSLK